MALGVLPEAAPPLRSAGAARRGVRPASHLVGAETGAAGPHLGRAGRGHSPRRLDPSPPEVHRLSHLRLPAAGTRLRGADPGTSGGSPVGSSGLGPDLSGAIPLGLC